MFVSRNFVKGSPIEKRETFAGMGYRPSLLHSLCLKTVTSWKRVKYTVHNAAHTQSVGCLYSNYKLTYVYMHGRMHGYEYICMHV